MFSDNEMAGRIIEVTVPPLLGPHVVDYLYTYEGESGSISDFGNRFTLIQNTRIVIVDPCIDCSIELTPVICNPRINLASRKFSEKLMIKWLSSMYNINGSITNAMGSQVLQPCDACIWSLSVVTTVGSVIITTLVTIIVILGCKLK